MMSKFDFTTSRFGKIQFEEEDILTLDDGVLGFPNSRRFVILQHKENSPFRWLQSIDEPSLAFFIVDPAYFYQDYAPEMKPSQAALIELSEETPRLVYTIVTIPKGKPEEMTVNLAGPIVINVLNRKARQVVVENPEYSVKHRVVPSQEAGQTASAAA